MTAIAKNSLLQIIWISSDFQHMDIMVCFQKDRIQIFQILHCIIIIFSKICCNCYGLPTLFNTISGRFICIMGNSKWVYVQFTKLKWVICLNRM